MDLEDRIAIQDLIADYAYFWDERDPERWASLFTPDGVLEIYVPGVRPPVRRVTNLGERITSAREAFVTQATRRTRIYSTSIRFDELTEDRALVRTVILVVEVSDTREGAIRPLYSGTSSDQFRKTPVGWRFAKREIHSDQNPGFGNAQDFDSPADAASD
ncbi:MAG: nuclear transport factor 2 family protein [Chloroflexi bacterium]|nr:nuclear transport factor 2 family protein [Chloroflexota bacterium]